MQITTIAKAIIAFLGALGTWGATAFADNGLNAVEAFGRCGVLVAAVTVWAVPNQPAPPDGGHSALYYAALVLAILAIVVLVIALFGDGGGITIGGGNA